MEYVIDVIGDNSFVVEGVSSIVHMEEGVYFKGENDITLAFVSTDTLVCYNLIKN